MVDGGERADQPETDGEAECAGGQAGDQAGRTGAEPEQPHHRHAAPAVAEPARRHGREREGDERPGGRGQRAGIVMRPIANAAVGRISSTKWSKKWARLRSRNARRADHGGHLVGASPAALAIAADPESPARMPMNVDQVTTCQFAMGAVCRRLSARRADRAAQHDPAQIVFAKRGVMRVSTAAGPGWCRRNGRCGCRPASRHWIDCRTAVAMRTIYLDQAAAPALGQAHGGAGVGPCCARSFFGSSKGCRRPRRLGGPGRRAGRGVGSAVASARAACPLCAASAPHAGRPGARVELAALRAPPVPAPGR